MCPGMLDGGGDSRVKSREMDSCMRVGASQQRWGVPSKGLCVLEGRELCKYLVWYVASTSLWDCGMVVWQVEAEGCRRQVS
jgi:hypothetical protein